MLAILSAVLGFASPFLPELIKLFREKGERAHEIAMLELRMKHAAAEHLWRMEEITARADIAEATMLHRPQPSFGVQILDAAKGWGFGKWAVVPAFYLFTLLDFVAGMVRPGITYAMFGFYLAYKFARMRLMQSVSDASFSWYEGVVNLWSEQDWAVLTLVLSYWFGHRAAKAAFGGSASSAKPGA